jgi:hypothetical protein
MAILIINKWDSRCDNCNQSADPWEDNHDTVLGYTPGEGCHVLFTEVSSDYVGGGVEETTRRMRPDLIFIDPLDRRL